MYTRAYISFYLGLHYNNIYQIISVHVFHVQTKILKVWATHVLIAILYITATLTFYNCLDREKYTTTLPLYQPYT